MQVRAPQVGGVQAGLLQVRSAQYTAAQIRPGQITSGSSLVHQLPHQPPLRRQLRPAIDLRTLQPCPIQPGPAEVSTPEVCSTQVALA